MIHPKSKLDALMEPEVTMSDAKHLTFKNIDKAGEVALFYGFTPHETPEIKKSDLDHSKTLLDGDFVEEEGANGDCSLPLHVEEKVSILRTYTEGNMGAQPQPLMLYFKGQFKNSIKRTTIFPRQGDLEILGSSKSICEAILIKTAVVILAEEGYKNICVDINSIGDRDSITKYTRELTNYYRKHISVLPAQCKQTMKKNIFELLSCKNEKCKSLNENAPKPMNFLTESSRTHFKEILEYLEKLEIPYRIKENLIGNPKYCAETVFEIINADEIKKNEHRTLAIGVRYDSLAKRLGNKKDIPSVGVSLIYKKIGKAEPKKAIFKVRRPIVYFVQLSFEAKLQSLKIIEILRKSKIPVYQSLSKDKLAAQIAIAERLKIPHMILMGMKEAMEESVIVRDTVTRAQDTVKIVDLPAYLKKMKIV